MEKLINVRASVTTTVVVSPPGLQPNSRDRDPVQRARRGVISPVTSRLSRAWASTRQAAGTLLELSEAVAKRYKGVGAERRFRSDRQRVGPSDRQQPHCTAPGSHGTTAPAGTASPCWSSRLTRGSAAAIRDPRCIPIISLGETSRLTPTPPLSLCAYRDLSSV